MASPNAMSPKANKSPSQGERRKTATSESNFKKPTRPLTAYHLFFQLEREYILQTTPATGNPNHESARPRVDHRPIGKEIDPAIPYRYRHIRLSPTWYESGSGKRSGQEVKKRKHRKTHGKIGFLDLSKRIAERWAGLEEDDRATKEYVVRIARRELEAYRRAAKEHKRKNAAAADFEVDSMDADEMKLWIERASSRPLDGMPNESSGEAIAAATPPENIMGRATESSQSQPAMVSFPRLKPEVHNMSYVLAEATASTSEAKSADLNVNPMDADEMKLWIKRASGRLLDGIPTNRAGKEVATAMLQELRGNLVGSIKLQLTERVRALQRQLEDTKREIQAKEMGIENRGRATAASSSQSQSAMPSFPWSKPEVNNVSYTSMELMTPLNYEATSSVSTTDADASVGRKGGDIEGNQQLLDPNANCTAVGKARMPVAASSDTKEKNAFDESSFRPATPSFWKRSVIAEKGGWHHHSSDPGIRLCSSEPSSPSFPMLGSSAPALYGHGRRETMPPVQPERVRHSFASTSSLFRAGSDGNSGRGNAHCGIGDMNNELDAFLSHMNRQRDKNEGGGFDFGGINPISHRPASAFDNARGPSVIEPPPLGLEDAVGMVRITPEDAVGLMKALSDGE